MNLYNNYYYLVEDHLNKKIIKNIDTNGDEIYSNFLENYLKQKKNMNQSINMKNGINFLDKEYPLIKMFEYIFNEKIEFNKKKENFFLRNILHWDNFYKSSFFFSEQINYIINKIISSKNNDLRILEIGSGSGSLSIKLAEKLNTNNKNYHFYISDLNKTYIRNLEKLINFENVSFHIIDVNEFKFAKKINFLIMNNVFHLIKNQDDFKTKINNILSNGSKIYIHENHRPKKNSILFFELIYMLFKDYRDLFKDKDTYGITTKKECLNSINKCFENNLNNIIKFGDISSIFEINFNNK